MEFLVDAKADFRGDVEDVLVSSQSYTPNEFVRANPVWVQSETAWTVMRICMAQAVTQQWMKKAYDLVTDKRKYKDFFGAYTVLTNGLEYDPDKSISVFRRGTGARGEYVPQNFGDRNMELNGVPIATFFKVGNLFMTIPQTVRGNAITLPFCFVVLFCGYVLQICLTSLFNQSV